MEELLDIIITDLEVAKKNKLKIIFTISCTAKNGDTYLSPCRIFDDFVVLGAICSNTTVACYFAKAISHLVDVIFVDIEKKHPPEFRIDFIETGNMYHLIRDTVPDHCLILPYRPNLLTVESAVEQCTDLLAESKNLKVGVVGIGNIGFKLSALLVESGFDVFGLAKVLGAREKSCESAINYTKPKGTISNFTMVDSLEKLAIRSDIILLCATDSAIINEANYTYFKNKRLLLDIGKNNICKSCVSDLPNARWLDVGEVLVKFVTSSFRSHVVRKNASHLSSNEKIVGQHALPGETLIVKSGSKSYAIGSITDDGLFKRFILKHVIESGR